MTISQTILPLLLDASIKGAVVLAAAGLLVKLGMRRSSASARHAVWMFALCGTGLMPLLGAVLPAWQILPTWMQVQVAVAAADAASPEVRPALPVVVKAVDRKSAAPQERTIPSSDAMIPERTLATQPVSEPTLEAAPSVPAEVIEPSTVERNTVERNRNTIEPSASIDQSAATATKDSPQHLVWSNWLGTAWLVGVAAMFLPLVASGICLRRLRIRACQAGSTWEPLLVRAKTDLGMTRAVNLLLSPGACMPMQWGILFPSILLPAESANWDSPKRLLVLLHELAHVKRWDCTWQLVAHCVRALFWFHPLVWIAAKQVHIERERACDDLVLNAGANGADYAERLLEVAARLPSSPLLGAAAIAMARPNQLEGRLLAILDAKRNRRTLTWIGVVAAALILAALVVPVTMLKAQSGDTPKAEPARAPERAAGEPTADQPADTRSNATIRGRVVGQFGKIGKPLAGIRVVATIPAANPALGGALSRELETVTDAEGKFQIDCLIPNVLCNVLIEKIGYGHEWARAISGQDTPLEIKLQHDDRYTTTTGTIVGVKNLTLELLGQQGFRTTTQTDADGNFVFELLPASMGTGVINAWQNGRVVALKGIGHDTKGIQASLVEPGTLVGKVADETGKPIAAAPVHLQCESHQHLKYSTKTNESGEYKIQVAPGEYHIRVDAPGYDDTRRSETIFSPEGNITTFTLMSGHPPHVASTKSGEEVRADIKLYAGKPLSGVVVNQAGQPVTDAVVAVLSRSDQSPYRRRYWSQTDAQGKFTLLVYFPDEPNTLAAFSPTQGAAAVTLEKYTAEKDQKLTVEGVARVRGKVLDAQDRPISDVWCWSGEGSLISISAADGSFDLGLVPLPKEGKLLVQISPPRPPRGAFSRGASDTILKNKPADSVRYYLPRKMEWPKSTDKAGSLPGGPGGTPVVLEETQLLTIRGQVVDRTGNPVRSGWVTLFDGNVDENWHKWRQTAPKNRAEPNKATLPSLMPLAIEQLNDEGRFKITVVRAEGESIAAGARFSLGVTKDDKARQNFNVGDEDLPRCLVPEIVIPADATKINLKIDMDGETEQKIEPAPPAKADPAKPDPAAEPAKPQAEQPAEPQMLLRDSLRTYDLARGRLAVHLPDGKLQFYSAGIGWKIQTGLAADERLFQEKGGKLVRKLLAVVDARERAIVQSPQQEFLGLHSMHAVVPSHFRIFDADGKRITDFDPPAWIINGFSVPLTSRIAALSDSGLIAASPSYRDEGPPLVRIYDFSGRIVAGKQNDVSHVRFAQSGRSIVWGVRSSPGKAFGSIKDRQAYLANLPKDASLKPVSYAQILETNGQPLADYEPEDRNSKITEVQVVADASTVVFLEGPKAESFADRITLWQPGKRIPQSITVPKDLGEIQALPSLSPDGDYIGLRVGSTGAALLRRTGGPDSPQGKLVWIKDLIKAVEANPELARSIYDQLRGGDWAATSLAPWSVFSLEIKDDGSALVTGIQPGTPTRVFWFELDPEGNAKHISEPKPQPAAAKESETGADNHPKSGAVEVSNDFSFAEGERQKEIALIGAPHPRAFANNDSPDITILSVQGRLLPAPNDAPFQDLSFEFNKKADRPAVTVTLKEPVPAGRTLSATLRYESIGYLRDSLKNNTWVYEFPNHLTSVSYLLPTGFSVVSTDRLMRVRDPSGRVEVTSEQTSLQYSTIRVTTRFSARTVVPQQRDESVEVVNNFGIKAGQRERECALEGVLSTKSEVKILSVQGRLVPAQNEDPLFDLPYEFVRRDNGPAIVVKLKEAVPPKRDMGGVVRFESADYFKGAGKTGRCQFQIPRFPENIPYLLPAGYTILSTSRPLLIREISGRTQVMNWNPTNTSTDDSAGDSIWITTQYIADTTPKPDAPKAEPKQEEPPKAQPDKSSKTESPAEPTFLSESDLAAPPSVDLGDLTRAKLWERIVAEVKQDTAKYWPQAKLEEEPERIRVLYRTSSQEVTRPLSKAGGTEQRTELGPQADGLLLEVWLTDQSGQAERPQTLDRSPWKTYLGEVRLSKPALSLAYNVSYGADTDRKNLTAFTNPFRWLHIAEPIGQAAESVKKALPDGWSVARVEGNTYPSYRPKGSGTGIFLAGRDSQRGPKIDYDAIVYLMPPDYQDGGEDPTKGQGQTNPAKLIASTATAKVYLWGGDDPLRKAMSATFNVNAR